MANPNKPQGFELTDSEGKSFRVREYAKSTSAALYRGQSVAMANTGLVGAAAASGQFIGVCVAYASAAATVVLVCDDPEAVFVAQADSTAVAQTTIGLNADAILGSPNTTLQTAGSYLDTANAAATATLQWKIIGLEQRGENAFGSYARLLVKPNNHQFKTGVLGI